MDESYYTPDRIRALLRLYPYLTDAKPPTDPELAGIARRVFGPGGWCEEAAAKRADIWNAVVYLEQVDWRAAYAVRAYYCVGLPFTDVAADLARHDGHQYHHETIRRWTVDGLQLMAQHLGWAGAERSPCANAKLRGRNGKILPEK